MALIIGDTTKVSIQVGDEVIVAEFPAYDDADFQKAIQELLDNRFVTRGKRVKNQSHQARVRFFDTAAINIQGVQYRDGGEVKALDNSVHGWKGKIPGDWKASWAAFFEEKETLTEEDREDL